MRNGDGMDNAELQNLPNGVLLSWGFVKQQRRGPKGELSVKQIVEAAIAIADKDGISAVSMSRIAQSLGFSTMSLYRYIDSKEDLLTLMQDTICEISIPPDEPNKDWREMMREYVRATVGVFLKHPWFGDLPVSGVPLTPNNLHIVDWALRSMRELPLNDYEKLSMVLLLSSYARSSGLIMRDMDRAVQQGSAPEAFSGNVYTDALKTLVTPERFPDLSPIVQSGVYTEENNFDTPVNNDFDFGLERILDGIEHYLSSKTKNPS
ncbi:TetR/AcrR family transcriptional regulator [Cohnella soli]|uniref:TetR/AcrR family transcriptional regulator n=1 Tax=Cohnella soli TaxID=425005 RepID=A0ABW0HRV3_9BACL